MARLPQPGGDAGQWGSILNDFLDVAHNPDGTLANTGTLANKADDSSVVHTSGAETVTGTKTFMAPPVVPTPTQSTHATTKAYVDSTVSAGAPDATTTNKGLVQLAGDLSGTATSPTVAKVNGITLPSSMPTTGQVLTATNNSATNWATPTPAPVTNVFGRTGAVTAQSGDYTFSQVGAAQGFAPTVVKTTAYTANAGDFVPVDASGGVTVTLPTTPSDGTRVAVKMVNTASSNTVTINSGSGDVFNKTGGSTSLTLSLLNQGVVLQYAHSSGIWYVQSDDLPLSQLDARYTDLTSNQTIGGTKTFTSAPVVPAASFPISAVANLASDLASLQPNGPNLLSANQTSLENGNTTGWTASFNDTIAATTAAALYGSYSLQLTSSAAGNMRADTPGGTSGIAVIAGLTYTALASVMAAATPRSCSVRILWYTSSGTFISTSGGTAVTDTTTGWTALSETDIAPASAAFADVQISINSTGAAGEVHYADGMSLALGTSLTWAPSGQIPSTNVFNSVRNYGAKGDGSTDDTAAIVNAINAGGVTFFPAGTYVISSTISLPPSAHLMGVSYWGSGYSPSVVGASASVSHLILKASSNTHMFKVPVNSIAPGNLSVIMENLYLDGNGLNNTSGDIIHLDDSSSYTITSSNFRISNCALYNPIGYALYVGQYNEDFRLDNSIFYGGTGYGTNLVYVAPHATDGIITNCDFGNGRSDNLSINASLTRVIGGNSWGSQTGCGMTINGGHKMSSIIGMGVDTNYQAGIRMTSAFENAIIDGCFVHDNSIAGDALYANIEHTGTGHLTVTSCGFGNNGESSPLPSYAIIVTSTGTLSEANNYVTPGSTRNGYMDSGSYAKTSNSQIDLSLTTPLAIASGGTGQSSLTGLPLTTPNITTAIDDVNGKQMLAFSPAPSAVNYIVAANAATGTGVQFQAGGSDSNVMMSVKSTGTFPVRILPGSDSTAAAGFYTAGGTAILRADSTNSRIAIGSSAPTSTLDVQGSQGINRTAVADAAYTVLATDYLIAYTALTAARTVTLPSAVGIGSRVYLIKDESGNAGTFNITIATSSSQTIDGASTYVINSAYGSVRIYTDGSNWHTIDNASASIPNPLPVTQGGTGLTSTTPYALLAGGTTATGVLQQVSGLGSSGNVLTSNGAGTLPTWQTVAGSLLGRTQYAPTTAATYPLGTAGFAALDSTNLTVTFTAPASGNVLVTTSVYVSEGATGVNVWLGLLNGSSLVGPTACIVNSGFASKQAVFTAEFLVTGLTAGNSYTFKLAGCASNSGTSIIAQNPQGTTSANPSSQAAPATIKVFAA